MTTTTSPTLELGSLVERNGERGEVLGFGSFGAVWSDALMGEACGHPGGFVVVVAMGRFRTPRMLRLSELRLVA